jgi:predicted deacylase
MENLKTDKYAYHSYAEMRSKLKQLALNYPRYMKLSDSEKMFSLRHRVNCGSDSPCKLDIVSITNHESDKPKKQVYISGTLHGDEIIGPNSAYYFIEYMLMAEKNPSLTNILENIEIIITPMTNAVGFFH